MGQFLAGAGRWPATFQGSDSSMRLIDGRYALDDDVVVRKERGKPIGRDHINDIEGFSSCAKNWLYPYRGVLSKFFHCCLAETCCQFNHRNEDMKPLLSKLSQEALSLKIQTILVRFG